jgi:hypothetical protein
MIMVRSMHAFFICVGPYSSTFASCSAGFDRTPAFDLYGACASWLAGRLAGRLPPTDAPAIEAGRQLATSYASHSY